MRPYDPDYQPTRADRIADASALVLSAMGRLVHGMAFETLQATDPDVWRILVDLEMIHGRLGRERVLVSKADNDEVRR